MLPKTVTCDECEREAKVRGYGRIEYDWPDSDDPAAKPTISSIRLAVDCPQCGVRVQDHYPDGRPRDANPASAREALLRLKALSAALRRRHPATN